MSYKLHLENVQHGHVGRKRKKWQVQPEHMVQVITVVKGLRAWICCKAADMFPEFPCTN